MNAHLIMIVLINALELAVLDTLFCRVLIKRRGFLAICVGLVAALCAYAFLVPLSNMQVFFHVPIIILSFLYIGFAYKTNFRTAMFLGIATYALQVIGAMVNQAISWFLPDSMAHFSAGSELLITGYILTIVCDAIVYIIAYFLIIKKLRNIDIDKKATAKVIILTGGVLVVCQFWLFGMVNNGYEPTKSVTDLIGYGWTMASCLLCLAVQFGMFTVAERNRELEITKRIISEKEQQYKLSKSNIEAINRKCHDLKYQLAALKSGEGDNQKHVDEALELVESFDSKIHTDNDTLDVIFTEKNNYCKKHEIIFVCMIDGEKLAFMDPVDQYVLFGNIIDNAINAVRKIKEHEKRSIYIKVHAEKKLLLIQTENPFVGTLTFDDGLPKTTSGDEFNHGFGMQSIRLIAEKYDGSVNTRAENNVFYLNVLIPLT